MNFRSTFAFAAQAAILIALLSCGSLVGYARYQRTERCTAFMQMYIANPPAAAAAYVSRDAEFQSVCAAQGNPILPLSLAILACIPLWWQLHRIRTRQPKAQNRSRNPNGITPFCKLSPRSHPPRLQGGGTLKPGGRSARPPEV